jgi:hypothetical protein
MTRRAGTGLLFIAACSACWVAPLLIALLGAGWAGALGGSWSWMLAVACVLAVGLVAARRIQRRRSAACGCS